MKNKVKSQTREWAESIIIAVILALIIRAFMEGQMPFGKNSTMAKIVLP